MVSNSLSEFAEKRLFDTTTLPEALGEVESACENFLVSRDRDEQLDCAQVEDALAICERLSKSLRRVPASTFLRNDRRLSLRPSVPAGRS